MRALTLALEKMQIWKFTTANPEHKLRFELICASFKSSAIKIIHMIFLYFHFAIAMLIIIIVAVAIAITIIFQNYWLLSQPNQSANEHESNGSECKSDKSNVPNLLHDNNYHSRDEEEEELHEQK